MEKSSDPSVYEIEFQIIDPEVYEAIADPSSECPSVDAENNTSATEKTEPVSDEADSKNCDSIYAEPTRADSLASKGILLGDASEESLSLAYAAVDKLLTQSTKTIVPIAQLADIAFGGERVPQEQFHEFTQALRRDLRLEYLGDGEYRVRTTDNILQLDHSEDETDINPFQLTHIADQTVDALIKTASNYPLGVKHLLGIVKSHGIYLNSEEVNEFIAILSSDPRIVPLENGKFITAEAFRRPRANQEEGILKLEEYDEVASTNGHAQSLTPRQVNKALKELKYGAEARYARKQAKRIANPRRSGRKRRSSTGSASSISHVKKGYQGKAHGKKLSVDELIAKMNQKNGDIK